MNKEETVLVFWDANMHGIDALLNAERGLSRNGIKITTILYMVCEYIYNDETKLDGNDRMPLEKRFNAKQRIEKLKYYYTENKDDSKTKFQVLIVPEAIWHKGDADNLKVIENTITDFIFPEIIKLNPINIHIPLTSGTQSMRFAWISLYTKSVFTRSFGNNVYIWQNEGDRSKFKGDDYFSHLYKVEPNKNPYIDAIETSRHKVEGIKPVDLDFDGKIRRNAAVDVPLLILGERGIGKSTIVSSIILPEKRVRGLVKEDKIQTVVCGQLDSGLAESELFGYEKGAFTGADKQVKGKIELANNGILFLDEIQDLPKNIQRKLLRAFQEKKFRRIGENNQEHEANFTLICASNNTLSQLQSKLDPDFFDRIATFKTYLKPLRKQPDSILKELWNNRWELAVKKGFILSPIPDDFSLVYDTLKESNMYGNIRDMEQLIAYIARDVYQGTQNISDYVKFERYKTTLSNWLEDYKDRYKTLNEIKDKDFINDTESENTKYNNEETIKNFLKENSWQDINNIFKKWLADTAINYFGSRKEAADTLHCGEKTLYNAKEWKN